jgi:photosystem II stability/assembly factor-like uncharacterized protein
MRRWRRGLAGSLVVVLLAVGLPGPASGQTPDPPLFSRLRFRTVGPDGNRTDGVAGEPGNPMVAYVGAASGGIFRTMDGGLNWEPVFDAAPVSSVNALAVAPSAPNVVWAGTGETYIIREALSIGDGVWKSTDRGDSWTHMGLDSTGRISEIAIDPNDPDVVYACALGSGFTLQQDRGVFKTTDGGRSWKRVLFVDENTGCADLALDPGDPQTLFAGMWQLSIKLWSLNSGGPGSGVFVTHDGGQTWDRVKGGLPTHPVGKISVAVARSDPQRVYALIEDADPSLYRSRDGGRSWRLVNRNHLMADRAPYYTRVRVAPDNADLLYFMSIQLQWSRDGGETLVDRPQGGGGDNHTMWIDPLDPQRMMVTNDGGVGVTMNRGRTWRHVVLPIAQVYHVLADNAVPYFLYTNRQDGPSYRGPSNSRQRGGITAGMWHGIGGGESGFGTPDTVSNAIMWSGSYDGELQRFDLTAMQARSVHVWPETGDGWAPADTKYRWNWTFPIAISPHDPNRVYVGSQVVHMTTDGGQSWKDISPDLTKNDKTHEQNSGGVTVDNLDTFDGATLWSIAESPLKAGLIWTGSNDGLVQITQDGGHHWENVTAAIPGLGPWGKISIVEPSHFDAGTAYIAADRHMMGDPAPYIYRTTDYGKSWKPLAAGISGSLFSYVHVVREDPFRKGMLYAGTENGLYFSLDDGATWSSLQLNMPHAPVYWVAVQPHFNDLLVATYGRGIWILDDMTPLRALDASARAEAVHLFGPRPAYRFRSIEATVSEPNSNVVGQNPPYGADINYLLKADAKGSASVTILDDSGHVVRTLRGSARSGLNRIWWDLRSPGPEKVVLRSRPLDASWVPLDQDGTRELTARHLIARGPLAPPGTYTVKLSVDGVERTAKLTVLKDPHSQGTAADIGAQVDFSRQIIASVDSVVRMINQMEKIRHQVADVLALLPDGPATAPVKEAARTLDEKTVAVEDNLFNVHLTNGLRDFHRNPTRLLERYGFLGTGVIEGGLDSPPTEQERAVFQLLQQRLATYGDQYRAYLSQDVAGFDQLLKSKDLGGVLGGPR